MTHRCIAPAALSLALGAGPDLPTQAARVRAEWLDGRQGRPGVFMLALFWARGCANVVHSLELQLDALFADYACTPEVWSEAQAVRQVLASLNMQGYRRSLAGETLPELAVGILLVQGDSAHFLRCGNVGLLRYRDGELQALPGLEDGSLGGQAELALTQHNLSLQAGEAMLLAPQPLLAVIDRRPLLEACRELATEDLDSLLAPLLRAPGAAALVLPGRSEQRPTLVLPTAWPAPPPLRPGDALEDWRVLEPLPFGPPQRLFRVRHADGRDAWLLASTQAADQAFWLREWALRCCKVASLPSVLSTRAARRHAFQVFAVPPGNWRSLAERHRAWRRLAPEETMVLLRQLVEALRALQRRGVQGLWVSPRQVLVDDCGRLLFLPELAALVPGVARQPLPLECLPLAPELRDGRAADSRAEQFVVAAFAYWLAGGRWPELALPDCADDALHYVPLAAQGVAVPPGWDGALARALAAEPAQRFDALSELMQALERPLAQARLPAQGWRRWAVVGAFAGALLLGGALYLLR